MRWARLAGGGALLVVAWFGRERWMSCLPIPYTVSVWLHGEVPLECGKAALVFRSPTSAEIACGRREQIDLRQKRFEACGIRFEVRELRRVPVRDQHQLVVKVLR